MATKAKKPVHPMPKLGWKDLLLYWTVMFGFGIFGIVALFLPIMMAKQIAFADPSVMATAQDEQLVYKLFDMGS